MQFEVEVIRDEAGLFQATAIAYPEVTANGRTEKEALGLLMEAMGRYMKKQTPTRQTTRRGGEFSGGTSG